MYPNLTQTARWKSLFPSQVAGQHPLDPAKGTLHFVWRNLRGLGNIDRKGFVGHFSEAQFLHTNACSASALACLGSYYLGGDAIKGTQYNGRPGALGEKNDRQLLV
jgi:hypothetical protein